MIPTASIPCPKGIWDKIRKGHRIVEYYCEPAMPSFRECWSYLLLVSIYDDDYKYSGAGVVCSWKHGLVQTLSFSDAEITALQDELSTISIPVRPPGVSALDGNNGCICLDQGEGTQMTLKWAGTTPEEWNPMLQWIYRVWELISDKAFHDDFDKAHPPPPELSTP